MHPKYPKTEKSVHGAMRLQQRGIPPLVVDWLRAYGKEVHDHCGCTKCFFDKQAWRELERDCGCRALAPFGRYRTAYGVFAGDGSLVTAGFLTSRMPQ